MPTDELLQNFIFDFIFIRIFGKMQQARKKDQCFIYFVILLIFQIEREVESFIGLKHSVFKNEDHLPGLGLDLGGYTSGDNFKVRQTFFGYQNYIKDLL